MIGLHIDRRQIPTMAAVLTPALMHAEIGRLGMTFLTQEAIFVDESFPQNPTWAGTKVGSSVIGGTLVADSPAFWGADGVAFWGTDTAAFWDPLSAWSYTFSVSPSTGAAGNALRVSYEPIGSPSLTIEWREDGVGAWNAYDPGPGITTSAGHSYEIRVSGGAVASDNGLETLSANIAVPAKIQKVSGFNIAAGTGTRLPLTLSFSVITSVVLTVLPYSSAVTAEAIDLNPTLGPLVKCYDTFGTSVFGVVNATIYGY